MAYHINDNTWNTTSPIPSGQRSANGCGMALNRQGEPEIVVAGGTSPFDVDIYNTETGLWKSSSRFEAPQAPKYVYYTCAIPLGISLPVTLSYMASVPYKDSFLLVAGYDQDTAQALDTIYEFDPFEERFNLRLGDRLRRARYGAGAVLVDAQAFPECN